MDWLTARSQAFRAGVQVATLDPFHGYKNAIDEELEDATAVLDAFHVVKLGTQAVDEVRRRVQQQIHGHRGRKGDPLYGIRNILHARTENLTDRQQARLTTAFAADPRHEEVSLAWQCAQKLRSVYHADTTTEGQGIAQQIIDTFPTCPIPEIARLGKTLKRWAQAFLAYFTTGRASNGGTEAINGVIEKTRRLGPSTSLDGRSHTAEPAKGTRGQPPGPIASRSASNSGFRSGCPDPMRHQQERRGCPPTGARRVRGTTGPFQCARTGPWLRSTALLPSTQRVAAGRPKRSGRPAASRPAPCSAAAICQIHSEGWKWTRSL